MTPNWVQYGMFFATVGIALITIGAAAVSYFLFRSQVDPHVIVYSKHDDNRSSILLIVIENIGNGIAHDVTFSLSRDIPRRAFGLASKETKEFTPMRDGPLISGVPLLAPGERRVITWGQFGGLMDSVGPTPVKVSAAYQSKRQFPWDPTDHVTESLLEIYSFEGTDASDSPEVRQVRELEKIAKAVEASGRAIRDLSSSMRQQDKED